MKHLTGHVAPVLAGQKQKGGSDFSRLPWAARRRSRTETVDLIGGLAAKAIERHPCMARCDGVDAYAALDQVCRKRPGKRGNLTFNSGVVEEILDSLYFVTLVQLTTELPRFRC